jgi:hypothetical protein
MTATISRDREATKREVAATDWLGPGPRMRLLITAILFAGVACADDIPSREMQSECPAISNQPVCEFRNGWLFRLGAIMQVYRQDGRFAFNVKARISDAAVDTDGSLIVAQPDRGIAMFDRAGRQTAFIDTKYFSPERIAVAPDHSIWVLGRGDDMILRKYSREGTLLGSWLPRSDPGGSATSLIASGTRIAAIVDSREIIELDLSGKVLGRMHLDRADFLNFALTSDGNLYTWDQTLMPYGGLILLDPVTGTSTKLESPGHQYLMIGADGNNLVYREPSDGAGNGVKVAWFHQPAR